ncbi:MAG: hypothetical protein LBV12_02150 [Puniceicoccales bacterium]|jgi:hypothetical protein|nr:hypothetical protein [Puniceicoccales bacterium]
MKKYLHILLVFFLAGCSSTIETSFETRSKAITEEIQSLPNHPWAGEYYKDSTSDIGFRHVCLNIAPQSGYTLTWREHSGLRVSSCGKVQWENDHIELFIIFLIQEKPSQELDSKLYPIQWGERHYLIPPSQMVDFCNDVSAGRERHYGFSSTYLLKCGDEKKQVSGLPDVPEQFRSYLLSTPINATITAVEPPALLPSGSTYLNGAEHNFKRTVVTLDVGSDQRLLVGMELRAIMSDLCVFKISKVETGKAEAVIFQLDEKDPDPQIGWKLSTNPYYAQATSEDSPEK